MSNYGSILAAMLVLVPSAAGAEKIVIGAVEAPPLGEEKAPGSGITPQILTASLKEVGYDVEYHFFPFLRLFKILDTGAILGGVASFPPPRAGPTI